MQRLNRKDIPHLKKHPYLRQKSKTNTTKSVFQSIKNNTNININNHDKQQKQNKPIANLVSLKPNLQNLPLASIQNIDNTKSYNIDLLRQTDSQTIVSKQQEINIEHQHYIQDINKYLVNRQLKVNINYQYLHNHNILTYKLRGYFVRHIFKLYKKFSLKRTTLYLSVEYMDLYFSQVWKFNDQSQVIAVVQACLFMAIKYEEIYPPSLKDWVDRRNIYQIIKIEGDIISKLHYQLNQYTLENHMQYLIVTQQKQGLSINQEKMKNIHFLQDLCLFDINIRQFQTKKIVENIYNMVNRPQLCDQIIVKNIRWMIERNKPSIQWLSENIYKHIKLDNII